MVAIPRANAIPLPTGMQDSVAMMCCEVSKINHNTLGETSTRIEITVGRVFIILW